MSELRYDPIFDRWICIAENRMGRPFEFRQTVARRMDLDCPFCPGNEHQTPPAIAEITAGGETGDTNWLVRIVPNKFPAFGANSTELGMLRPTGWDPNRSIASGLQEVIIISPRHITSIAELYSEELSTSFQLFRQRIAVYQQSTEVEHVCLFMNCRPQSGASIEHAHFQLIGAPICTQQVRQQYDRMISPASDFDGTTWEQLIDFELRQESRILELTPHFIIFCPYASKYAYQVRIIPRNRSKMFSQLDLVACDELAERCRQWTQRLERCLNQPAYNIAFFLPPSDMEDRPWFVEIIPRLSRAAGFEMLTDFWLNPTAPETAAQKLRGEVE